MRTLKSGSRGNSTLIMTNNSALLVDCGISLSCLKRELLKFNLTPNDLSGVLITHEHTDHTSGLKFIPKNIPIICHEQTFKVISKRHNIENYKINNFELGFEIDDISIFPFRIPHDAAHPVGYSFYKDGIKISIATDIGHITEGIVNNLKGADILFLESNHDDSLLKNGPYPKYLKVRIAGLNGHLSNQQTGELLKDVYSPKLKGVMLGHLSEQNNRPDLALDNIHYVLRSLNSNAKAEVCLQNKPSSIFEV